MCIAEGSAFCDFGAGGDSVSVDASGLINTSGGSSGILSNDFGANLPAPSPSSGLPCDFGPCDSGASSAGLGFQAGQPCREPNFCKGLLSTALAISQANSTRPSGLAWAGRLGSEVH